MLREEYSEKVMYEVKPEGAEGNLPWEYLGDDDFRKEIIIVKSLKWENGKQI